MEKVTNFVEGKCMEMCPREEMRMREKEKLLHVLEMVPGTEKSRHPKARKDCMVKAFSRSAAGKQIKVDSLRPSKVLLQTVKYLLCDVITTKTVPWHVVYDFITDRLMAVRQDMVIQNISKAENIALLQPIVRFHAYAAYKLCDHNVAKFDSTLNNNHLQECLKRLLHCYDSYDYLLNLESSDCNNYIIETRPEFEALYLVFNLGNDEALRRSLTIPKTCRTNLVKNAMQASFCFKYGNFVRLCRLIHDFPPLLAAVTALHLPVLRRRAFQTMSIGYRSENLYFPAKALKDILLYGSEEEVAEDCRYYNITINDGCVYFTKRGFDPEKNAVSPRHETFVDAKFLQTNVQAIVLVAENVVMVLRRIRSRVANYQEMKGVSKSEQYSFVDLIKALCEHTYAASLSIVTMIYNLLPLIEGFAYLLRFLLDRSIDILETQGNGDKAFKSFIFVSQVIILTILVYFIFTFLLLPIVHFLLFFFYKILRASTNWK